MNKAILFLALLLLCGSAFAATDTNYRSSPEGLLMGAGTAEGSIYSTQHALGDPVIGTASGSAYSTDLGFMASSVSYATREAGAPYISDLKFDGLTIISGDYVNSDVAITATITSGAGSIDTSTSSIEIDSESISFEALTGDSTFDASSGSLTYKHPGLYEDGTHTVKITARNNLGNVASLLISFRVESGEAKLTSPVLNDPNPFNPNQESTEIAYRLNADANITVYLFNSLGQLIWKREYAAGSEGGHAGYNEITWNGISDFGEVVGNDVYLCRIVSNGKVIGRGKIAVIK